MHSPHGCQEKGKALSFPPALTVSAFYFSRCEATLVLILSEDGRSGCVGEVSLPDSESGQVTTVGPLLHPLCRINRLRQGSKYSHFHLHLVSFSFSSICHLCSVGADVSYCIYEHLSVDMLVNDWVVVFH